MPVDGSSSELLNGQNSSKKKRSNKKRRQQQQRKIQSKTRLLDANDQSTNGIKNVLTSNRYDLNKLTPANLASLRWDNILSDPTLEHERIERYKEHRRQRYIEARQQTIDALSEQMQVTSTNDTATLTSADQA